MVLNAGTTPIPKPVRDADATDWVGTFEVYAGDAELSCKSFHFILHRRIEIWKDSKVKL